MRRPGIASLLLAASIAAAAAQDGAFHEVTPQHVAPQDAAPQDLAPETIPQEPGQERAPANLADIVREMKSPRLSHSQVDWDAVAAELGTIEVLDPARSGGTGPAAPPTQLLARLNSATGERFAGIAASPVPVLLPFDTAAFLRARAAPAPEAANPAANPPGYLSGFSAAPFFYPGPAGYDAVVVARASEMRELGIGFADPIYVHIGGSALLYELDEPARLIGWPVNGLNEIPGIRRMFLENYVRYTFVRYGVPYVVAIECFDGGARFRKISCRDADKVAVRFLKSLHVVGGTPQREPDAVANNTIDRPTGESTVFTYHSPGDILSGTGFRGKGGVADYTVYSKIRFPLADAPAFANSQSFMNWGNCEATGRSGAGTLNGASAYRCRVNPQTLIWDESAAGNYSYPWRDNFCETRYFYVGQCPAGLGHQGQDIRPANCKQRMPGANRCEPYLHDVVAVRDGAVLRSPGQESIYIVANTPNERIRFRYLHMLPRQFDANGFVNGRLVREGEVIGRVGNYYKRERGTTYHLHFDVQVPTKYGWVFVNPYMTLVAAYERLIRGRGQELRPDSKPEPKEEVPTASIPEKPVSAPPPPAEAPAAPEPPAAVAAKPTEMPVESPAAATIDSGTPHEQRVEQEKLEREPPSVTASVPAAVGPGRTGDLEHGGEGTRQ